MVCKCVWVCEHVWMVVNTCGLAHILNKHRGDVSLVLLPPVWTVAPPPITTPASAATPSTVPTLTALVPPGPLRVAVSVSALTLCLSHCGALLTSSPACCSDDPHAPSHGTQDSSCPLSCLAHAHIRCHSEEGESTRGYSHDLVSGRDCGYGYDCVGGSDARDGVGIRGVSGAPWSDAPDDCDAPDGSEARDASDSPDVSGDHLGEWKAST